MAKNVKDKVKPTKPIQLVLPKYTRSPHECISDLENLPLVVCVQLTRRLLTSVSTLPPRAESSRAFLLDRCHSDGRKGFASIRFAAASEPKLTNLSEVQDMGAGVSQGGIVSILFSLYINDIHISSDHAELSLYSDNTTILTTFRQAALLVTSTDSYLND